jgi:hypothetical protein
MPNFLSQLKNKLALSDHNDASPDAPAFRPPCFSGAGALADSFKHELGAHGWGNNELQNYVDGGHCSFVNSDVSVSSSGSGSGGHPLVIRAHAQSEAGRFESARLRSKFTLADGPGGATRGYLWAKITAPVAGELTRPHTVNFVSQR